MSLPEQAVATLSSLRSKLPEAPAPWSAPEVTPSAGAAATPSGFDTYLSSARDGVRVGLPQDLAKFWAGRPVRLEALGTHSVRLYFGDCASQRSRVLQALDPQHTNHLGLHRVTFTRGLEEIMRRPFGRTAARAERCKLTPLGAVYNIQLIEPARPAVTRARKPVPQPPALPTLPATPPPVANAPRLEDMVRMTDPVSDLRRGLAIINGLKAQLGDDLELSLTDEGLLRARIEIG